MEVLHGFIDPIDDFRRSFRHLYFLKKITCIFHLIEEALFSLLLSQIKLQGLVVTGLILTKLLNGHDRCNEAHNSKAGNDYCKGNYWERSVLYHDGLLLTIIR